MSHQIHPLTADQLTHLPVDCQSCVFWELPKAPRGPQTDHADDAREAKQLWCRSVELEWGAPGFLLVDHDRTLGFASCMPAEQGHRARRLGVTPSDDALLLATLWIDPEVRGSGLATTLLHRVLKHAHDTGRRAVEATGARGAAAPCLLPEQFLLASGFVVHHQHPRFPLLRLDLRQTVRWQDAMEHALEGVRAVLSRRDRRTIPTTS
ncbi:MAG: GNAT family N-acetyltransferase [Actinobacteria bacterium]|nr:GNAT family N-acetyltransferase [Actinomycetota bacterium]